MGQTDDKNDLAEDTILTQDYKKAGFGGSLGIGKRPALLIIDLCMAYLDPHSPLYANAEKAAENTARLLDQARRSHIPVFHTRVEYDKDGLNGGLFYRKVRALSCFTAGNPLARPPAALTPADGEIIVTKQYASGFFGTSLSSSLNAVGIDTLFITGVSTSGCVRATALDALQNGFIPIVVEDAVGDRTAAVHKANLFDLKAKYADLTTTEEALSLFSQF